MVAIVIILAAIISTFALGFAENFSDPAPIVSETTGEFVPGASTQKVRVTHVAGDKVRIENVEIVVRASGPDLDTEARLVDLPTDDFFSSAIDDSNIEGNKALIDKGNPGSLNKIIDREGSDTWAAGDTIQFAINKRGADFTDGGDADELEIIIVHTPSNAILSEETFTP
jgi:FlaG/FlaF family flagellin (archaellin)